MPIANNKGADYQVPKTFFFSFYNNVLQGSSSKRPKTRKQVQTQNESKKGIEECEFQKKNVSVSTLRTRPQIDNLKPQAHPLTPLSLYGGFLCVLVRTRLKLD